MLLGGEVAATGIGLVVSIQLLVVGKSPLATLPNPPPIVVAAEPATLSWPPATVADWPKAEWEEERKKAGEVRSTAAEAERRSTPDAALTRLAGR